MQFQGKLNNQIEKMAKNLVSGLILAQIWPSKMMFKYFKYS